MEGQFTDVRKVQICGPVITVLVIDTYAFAG
jgi:hypothetical protein